MVETTTLREALDGGGAFAVWSLLSEDEQKEAAGAFWSEADAETRGPLEEALAKALKFRKKSVRKLAPERVAPRLVRLIDELPEPVAFQYLFHLHMGGRRTMMSEFLDALELPHEDGALELPEEGVELDEGTVGEQAKALLEKHGRSALVYLSTLWVADDELWSGLKEVLEGFDAEGEAV